MKGKRACTCFPFLFKAERWLKLDTVHYIRKKAYLLHHINLVGYFIISSDKLIFLLETF